MEYYHSSADRAALTAESDERLAQRALTDDRAFEILVERYEQRLRRYVVRLIRCSAEDAEDVVQEVFINAYRNLNGFDANLKFSSWLYRIAHNAAVSHVRRVAARPTVRMEDELFDTLASELNMEHDLGRKIEDAQVRAAIDRLDPKYRDVLVLRYLEDRDYGEISDILQKPLGSVSSLITRAKKLLSNEIESKT
ncbi:MAG: sigma-70 family RNA polymerase sigma factor [Patescibacteria group bacterium]|nr:sigma-70 family RNA polymerase sigma factor [Patescibacteria group bacterium]